MEFKIEKVFERDIADKNRQYRYVLAVFLMCVVVT